MNNSQIELILSIILGACVGILLNKIYIFVKFYYNVKKVRQKYPSLEKAKSEDICKGPHTWNQIKLAIKPLPFGTYTVCSDCGFVCNSSGNLKLNSAGMEVFKNELKRLDEEKVRKEDLLKKRQIELDAIMNKLVREFYNQDIDSYALQNFFRKSVIEIESLYLKLNKEI